MPEQENEARVDFKGTLEKFVQAEEPELSQEEAIMTFQEKKSKKSNNDDNQSGGNTEEQEHLARVKKELLASLERVKLLAKKIYGDGTQIKARNELKIDSQGGKGKSIEPPKREVEQQVRNMESEQKERE